MRSSSGTELNIVHELYILPVITTNGLPSKTEINRNTNTNCKTDQVLRPKVKEISIRNRFTICSYMSRPLCLFLSQGRRKSWQKMPERVVTLKDLAGRHGREVTWDRLEL